MFKPQMDLVAIRWTDYHANRRGGGGSLQFLGFPNDIDIIIGWSTAKTKYLLAGDSDHRNVVVDGDNLDVVKEFCYLGTVVTSDNDISSEIRFMVIVGTMGFTD